MTVSVVIPCLNVDKYLTKCLDSVLDQTHRKIEIILVDNNSTDKTSEIITSYSTNHSNITAHIENEQGATYARNLGLRMAKGDWIQFLDADDFLLPHKITHQLNLIGENTSLAFIAASYYKKALSGKLKQINPKIGDSFLQTFLGNLGITSANLWKRSALNSIGGWKDGLFCSQEYELIFRLLANSYTYTLDRNPLTIVQRRAFGQISYSNWEKTAMTKLSLRKKWANWLAENHPDWHQKNNLFLIDMYYDAIRALGTKNVKEAHKLYEEILPNNYYPKPSPINSISLHHAAGVRILGFKNYINFSNKIKSFIKIFLPKT